MNVIKTGGADELVVLTRAEFDALTARAVDPSDADEEAWLIQLYDEAKAALDRGDDVALPEAVWLEIEGGADPVRVIRNHRGLAEGELAGLAAISSAELSDVESGRQAASPDLLNRLAAALNVPPALLGLQTAA